ncbi:MAG: hypothetical protein AAGE52_13955 [Myxococcota bacterium]
MIRWASTALLILSIACSSTNPLYAPCGDSSDCGGDAEGCYRLRFQRSDGSEADGRLCTKPCVSDAECPNGLCAALAGDPDETFLCFETCAGETCFEGQACTTTAGAGMLCLP